MCVCPVPADALYGGYDGRYNIYLEAREICRTVCICTGTQRVGETERRQESIHIYIQQNENRTGG